VSCETQFVSGADIVSFSLDECVSIHVGWFRLTPPVGDEERGITMRAHRVSRASVLTVAFVILALVVAACGGTEAVSTPTQGVVVTTPTAAASPADGTPAGSPEASPMATPEGTPESPTGQAADLVGWATPSSEETGTIALLLPETKT